MKQQNQRARRSQGGFTLLELTFVVIVLGILIYALVPKEDPDKARAVAMLRAMDTIGAGATRLRAEAGCTPTRPDALFVMAQAQTSTCGIDLRPRWRGPYMGTSPVNGSGDVMAPNISASASYSFRQAAGGAGVQYFVRASNVPNNVITRALEECNGTATAVGRCSGIPGGGGSGTFDALYDETAS